MVPILTVADHFDITGRGLVLLPDFSVPVDWHDRREIVRIVTPSGEKREVHALFNWTHFVIRDPAVPADKRSRVVLLLSNVTKKDVPIGSRVYAPEAVVDALLRSHQKA